MNKKLLAAVGVGLSGLLLISATTQSKVTIKGSDTMVILSQRWAEAYMKIHPDQVLQVTGGGSGTGFAALLNGTTEICNASRPIKQKEIDKVKEKFGTNPVEINAAVDGIALYVHELNPVSEITFAQIKGIYTGSITSWKEIGGKDEKIIPYGRENSSGTYEFFREHVLENADYSAMIQSLPGTAAVVNAVAKDKIGIGYGGMAYGKGIKLLKVKKDSASVAVAPEVESIKNHTYPISRYLYMYTAKKPEGSVKAFIDWVLTAEGQKVVTDVGYFPLR